MAFGGRPVERGPSPDSETEKGGNPEDGEGALEFGFGAGLIGEALCLGITLSGLSERRARS